VKARVFIDACAMSGIHGQLLVRHGGAGDRREGKLLESVLARARQQASSLGLFEMATAYIAGIVKNQPFVDGNKRTGFVVGVLFLELNGFDFIASEGEAAQAVLELAAGTIDETGFTLFLGDHVKRARKRAKLPF
jgi:death-on-curing protein